MLRSGALRHGVGSFAVGVAEDHLRYLHTYVHVRTSTATCIRSCYNCAPRAAPPVARISFSLLQLMTPSPATTQTHIQHMCILAKRQKRKISVLRKHLHTTIHITLCVLNDTKRTCTNLKSLAAATHKQRQQRGTSTSRSHHSSFAKKGSTSQRNKPRVWSMAKR